MIDQNKHFSRLIIPERVIVYSYFMPVCSIVKTITLRYCGRPDALLYKADEFEFEPHRRHCVVSLSEMLCPLLSTGLTHKDPSLNDRKKLLTGMLRIKSNKHLKNI